MSQFFSSEDEAELQSLLRQLLKSVRERIANAPSVESVEEILLHLEETDKNFHNYEFVKYLRQYVESSLGAVIEEETESCSKGEGHGAGSGSGSGSGQDTLVHAVTRRTRESAQYKQMMQTLKQAMTAIVESLLNKFEEDQLKNEETCVTNPREPSSSHYTDNCSDSDSSLNQSYGFIKQEQLQVISEKLDPSRSREVRWEALQLLCCAPPSDVLSCESWTGLRRNLTAALADPDPDLSDKVLRFFAKTFSTSPLNVTREIYTSLVKSLESDFLYHKLSFPSESAHVDANRSDITRLLKQTRLMNDFQKEVTTFWIRHPEKYMEEIIESTLALLSLHDMSAHGSDKVLEPVHFLALLDIKASWFKRWMHGYYSRTVVLKLLERKYKAVIASALQQCIYYLESCDAVREGTLDVGHAKDPQQIGSAQRSCYSAKELEYAHFVHSLCVLGRLLMYTNGRKLFPIKVRKRRDPVTLSDLVVILINILYQHPNTHHSDLNHADSFSPTALVMEVLRTLCERTECAVECIYQIPVIETLLIPILALLKGKQAKLHSPESSLTHIADTLARIATTERGLALFLYERKIVKGEENKGEGIPAAHVIVQFTQALLAKELPACEELQNSAAVKGAFIFVCRQMYNTCEGLQVLRPYSLHECIAQAWRKASSLSERIPTPVPGAPVPSSSQDLQSIMAWDEMLLDNLLNFAATPKGLMLLQQTGAIHECVAYMFTRFTKKLQVSRCEKFGYGVMVTQVAATAPGIVALRSSGFIQAIVVELWSALECGREDVRVVHPKSIPMEPIDWSCLKSFLTLVNLLSSPHAVLELLGHQVLPNKTEYSLREMPTSILDVMDRLVVINSDAKIHSLFNYEQSHTFGLRLLSAMCCNLDSLLLLESQYKLSEILLQNQKDNVVETSTGEDEVIIDGISVERNHLLVRMNVVGGPSERKLPARELQKGDNPYPWLIFSSLPGLACYTLEMPKTSWTKQDSEVSAFLSSSKDGERDENWMENCRRHLCKAMISKSRVLTGRVLADLLERAVLHLSSSPPHCFFPPAEYKVGDHDIKARNLTPVEQLGIGMAHRYGSLLKLVREDSEQDLCLLIKHCQEFLSQQRTAIQSDLCYLQGGYPGHDWLCSTIFLLMGGDVGRSLNLLLRFSRLLTSAFLWPPRIYRSEHIPAEMAQSGVPPLYSCTAHYVEMLLKSEVPLVSSAFRMSGFTPSQMCLQWLTQCFWNYLDWPEICHYVTTCIIMGVDYQVYMCVAVLKHLQQDILQHTQTQDLQLFLKEDPIEGFRVGDYLEYMESLERRYRSMVLIDMRNSLLKNT
ncbi:protein broad-minded isoform X1 [Silurus meridionalis]|nr:protein broad-minded isoform X1 [Silurus meridionalis]